MGCNDHSQPTIILLTGMHRSGTSLVARGLHAMGLNLGDRVDTEPHPANPHGHWEHADVWRAQERLLVSLGREWHASPGPLPPRWLEWPDTIATIGQFTAIATTELCRRGHWVVKDPRTSLLIPLWRDVARRLDARLTIVRIVRNADDVAASLAVRDGIPHDRATQMWNDHQRSIDRDSAGLEMLTIRHAMLVREPIAVFGEIGAFCGLTDAGNRAPVAAALVDEALWHHRRHADSDNAGVPSCVDFRPDPGPPVDKGRVLIVMRTRWRPHVLSRGLRSVLCQTYRNWFLQIVNDGGPRGVVERAVAPYRHLFEGRIGILHHERCLGMEAASNAGIAAAPGDFIAIHDDDDTWNPEFLERMVSWLHDAGCQAVACRSRIVGETWKTQECVRRWTTDFGPWISRITATDLAASNLFPPIAFLFRRSLYEEAGPYHEGLPALGDWLFNRRVAARHVIDVLPESLANWHRREHGDSVPNSPQIDHLRFEEHVRNWPNPRPLPPFSCEMRQVEWWAAVDSRDGPRFVMPDATSGDRHGAATPVLPSGLYLLRFQPPRESIGATWLFYSRTAAGFSRGQAAPFRARAGESVTVLLNAREPVLGLGVAATTGPVRPLPGRTEVIRLADDVAAIGGLATTPRLPDVLCIGAQRSGTTWLHAALSGHAKTWTSGIKEYHHFDWDGADPAIGRFRQEQAIGLIRTAEPGPGRDDAVRRAVRHGFPTGRSWEDYAATFEGAPADRVVCDFTPAYATLGECDVADIVGMMPDVKVIFVLRDPVTRALSGARHRLRRAGVTRPSVAQLRDACAADDNVLRTDYLRTLRLWERHLSPDHLLILFFDDLVRDPLLVLERTCGFVGIPVPDEPESIITAANGHRNAETSLGPWPDLAELKAELSQRWLPQIIDLESRFGEPVHQWRRAAETRVRAMQAARAGAGAGGSHTVGDNLAQWDVQHRWPAGGDEWDGQARRCGIAYDSWKAGMIDRYQSLFPHGGTILEIGPGHGRWSDWLVDRAGLLVLCDLSPNCLDVCRERLAGRGRLQTFVVQEAELPPDLTGRVDALWSYDCLVHVAPEQCARYMAEIARVLRPGGVAVLHHAGAQKKRVRVLADAVIRWCRRHTAPADVDSGWRSAVSSPQVAEWARAAGLEVERQESTWAWKSPSGPVRIGVPRFGDAITVVRRPGGRP